MSLTIAAERQTWNWRRTPSSAGERAPAGRIHAVLGAATRTLCGTDVAELAAFPYLDFTASTLERCEVCRAHGARLLR